MGPYRSKMFTFLSDIPKFATPQIYPIKNAPKPLAWGHLKPLHSKQIIFSMHRGFHEAIEHPLAQVHRLVVALFSIY